jgi:3'-phosphoadenosine 5'-phosphosulfate sulfotransferase (PAPS reductase)/FAD synthetase
MSANVVSLSGGKDSTAMLLMMLERGIDVDEVVFIDTGMEFPQMYEHLDRVERFTGIHITRLTPEKSFFQLMFDEQINRSDGMGYGWPRPYVRWCTSLIKVKTERRYFHGMDVNRFIGIAADESHRCRRFNYPLVEWGVTEADALAYCKANGFDWGGLYDHFKRVSCWCCPLQSLNELRMLRKFHPNLWCRLREMDTMSWNQFRPDYSVAQLEERFLNEDRQLRLFRVEEQ